MIPCRFLQIKPRVDEVQQIKTDDYDEEDHGIKAYRTWIDSVLGNEDTCTAITIVGHKPFERSFACGANSCQPMPQGRKDRALIRPYLSGVGDEPFRQDRFD